MWNISVAKQYNKLNINTLIFYYVCLNTRLPLNYKYVFNNEITLNYLKASSKKVMPEIVSSVRLRHMFKVFHTISFLNYNSKVTIHPTQKYYYLSYSSGGSSLYSISLLYNLFSKIVLLLFNIYYFNIKFLSFGSNATKSNILAISWSHLSLYKHLFRYSPQSIFFTPNKMNDKYPFVFPFWKLQGYNVSIIYDVTYHLKTLYYLHRFNFYSIGFIPANLPKYKLSLAVPVLNDSWLTQLFLVRITTASLITQKSLYYKKHKKAWYTV